MSLRVYGIFNTPCKQATSRELEEYRKRLNIILAEERREYAAVQKELKEFEKRSLISIIWNDFIGIFSSSPSPQKPKNTKSPFEIVLGFTAEFRQLLSRVIQAKKQGGEPNQDELALVQTYIALKNSFFDNAYNLWLGPKTKRDLTKSEPRIRNLIEDIERIHREHREEMDITDPKRSAEERYRDLEPKSTFEPDPMGGG